MGKVGGKGIEPLTSRLWAARSSNWSTRPSWPGGVWTLDRRLIRTLHHRTVLRVMHLLGVEPKSFPWKGKKLPLLYRCQKFIDCRWYFYSAITCALKQPTGIEPIRPAPKGCLGCTAVFIRWLPNLYRSDFIWYFYLYVRTSLLAQGFNTWGSRRFVTKDKSIFATHSVEFLAILLYVL